MSVLAHVQRHAAVMLAQAAWSRLRENSVTDAVTAAVTAWSRRGHGMVTVWSRRGKTLAVTTLLEPGNSSCRMLPTHLSPQTRLCFCVRACAWLCASLRGKGGRREE